MQSRPYRRLADDHPFLLSAVLYILLVVASLGIGWVLAHTAALRGFDRFFYESISRHPNAVIDALVRPFNLNFLPFGVTPSYLNVWAVLLLGYLALFDRRKFAPAVLSILLAFAMSLLILYLNTRFVFRTRPFVIFPNSVGPQLRGYLIHVTSWPSGHVRDTAIFAALTSRYIPRLKWPSIVFALFIAFSRVYIGAHYPTDVIGGLLLGWAIGELALFITINIWKRTRWGKADAGL